MRVPLIGIMGLKQSGKDTFAARLTADHGFTRLALADPMRDFALALDPWVVPGNGGYQRDPIRLSGLVRAYGWDKAKENFPEIRRTLQRLGTEAGREVLGESTWIDVTDRKVTAILPAPVVVTDVRFPNEYGWIRERGGVLVRVIRPGQESSDAHPSEAMAVDLDGYPADFTALNGGTVADLHDYADIVARVLVQKTSSV